MSELPRKNATTDPTHQTGHELAQPTDQRHAQPQSIATKSVERFSLAIGPTVPRVERLDKPSARLKNARF